MVSIQGNFIAVDIQNTSRDRRGALPTGAAVESREISVPSLPGGANGSCWILRNILNQLLAVSGVMADIVFGKQVALPGKRSRLYGDRPG